MLSLVFSNRHEALLDRLLNHLGAVQPGPFGVREIIVASSAMQRHIELAVAEREGIAANLRFAYLAQWLWGQIGKVVAVGADSPFAPALLAWRIFELLGDAAWARAHPRLARYLDGADEPMRFELAERCARLFDQYLTYRPHWLARWAEGRSLAGEPGFAAADQADLADEAWQADLWRRIDAALGARREHPASAFLRAIERAGPEAVPGLPQSVQVYCLPALPPLYLNILGRLARWVDVRAYVLNPCREYWFEVVAPRRLAWLVGQQRGLYQESGNRLLASWGRQTQAHIDLLLDADGEALVDDSAFERAHGDNLLACIQNAILDLEDPAPGSVTLAEIDRSVEVHVCHGLIREIEVLQDRLLDLFAGADPPRPQDVLVVTPDLDRAAALIEAVFGNAPADRHIPWQITGLGQTRVNPVARVLDSALALAAGRHPASRVFELLQQAPVAQRFGFERGDLEQVHDWLNEAGVRWGLDGAHRDRLGLPGGERHTLAQGLHRLFLAYAWGDDEGTAAIGPGGHLPAGNPEGSAALALGQLWRYAESIHAVHAACAGRLDADGWRSVLLDILQRLVPDGTEWIDDVRTVQAAISQLHAQMHAAALRTTLPLEVVHRALANILDDPARGGVPSGAVTFAAIPSLRNLAYRVVCAIGLDDGVFPGVDRPLEFDLMARRPARGDRQRRSDERNLFLDLLLAARTHLHLSCSGRSVRDNSEKPPSVLVDELLDYAARMCAVDPADAASRAAARRRLTVVHPLQAFSRLYFSAAGDSEQRGKDPRLNSFNREYCEALRERGRSVQESRTALLGAHPGGWAGAACRAAGVEEEDRDEGDEGDDKDPAEAGSAPFFAAPLAPPDAAWQTVSLDSLLRFFRHPSRYLLAERLRLALPRGDEELLDDEPFLPDWPARQRLAERLMPALLAGNCVEPVRTLAIAAGEYPAGALGERLLEGELELMEIHAARLRAALAPATLPALAVRLEFDLQGEAWVLESGFADLRPSGLVRYRYDDARATDYLGGWLTHLVLCVAAPDGVDAHTEWHSRDGLYRLRACDDARARLAELLALYRSGLRAPLPFFPKSAWAWASSGKSRVRAQHKWQGGQRVEFGECNDAAIRLAFDGRSDLLDERFYAIAASVFDPLMQHLDDARL